jgi:hypothetical protein
VVFLALTARQKRRTFFSLFQKGRDTMFRVPTTFLTFFNIFPGIFSGWQGLGHGMPANDDYARNDDRLMASTILGHSSSLRYKKQSIRHPQTHTRRTYGPLGIPVKEGDIWCGMP